MLEFTPCLFIFSLEDIMRFAVCDDDEINLRFSSLLIREYLQANNLEIDVDSYSTAESFLRFIDDTGANPYIAVFLDIELGDALGIDVARKLRETDRKFFLIFITGHSIYMGASFELHTYDYIQKPFNRDRLFKLLDRLIPDIDSAPSITFPSDRKTIQLLIEDILYITGRRNGSIFITDHEEFPSSLSMKELSEILKPPICRCHNGYFVNIQHISEFQQRTVTMNDGKRIATGRAFHSDFLHEYNLFK